MEREGDVKGKERDLIDKEQMRENDLLKNCRKRDASVERGTHNSNRGKARGKGSVQSGPSGCANNLELLFMSLVVVVLYHSTGISRPTLIE